MLEKVFVPRLHDLSMAPSSALVEEWECSNKNCERSDQDWTWYGNDRKIIILLCQECVCKHSWSSDLAKIVVFLRS